MKNLKLPTLKKSEGDREGGPAAPKFLSDLYRDLSDRHLLLPLIGLLVAIVAVPMLLSSSGSTDSSLPMTAPDAGAGDATALDAAVIVSDPGIRNYRERLSALQAKSPFEAGAGSSPSGGNEGTATTTIPGDGADSDSGAATASTGSSSSPSASTGSTSSGSVSIDTGSDAGSDTTPPPTGTPDTGTPDTNAPDTNTDETKPQTRFFASRIDVNVGPVGKMKEIEGVKALEFLPDQKAPVVAYLGLVDDTHALFSVNPGVAEAQGEGDCAPSRNACMYVSLKIGEEHRFVYGDEDKAKIYRLKLLDMHVVRVPDPRDSKNDGDDGKQANRAPLAASSRSTSGG